MNSWVTILSFTYPHEAHLAKANLEAEGIEVVLKDEFTAQINNFYSDAIGGVKVQVLPMDVQKAQGILEKGGYYLKTKEESSILMNKLDRFSSSFPIIGQAKLEVRLFVVILILLLVVLVPVLFFLLS